MTRRTFGGLKASVGSCLYSGFDEDGYPIAQHDGHGEDPQVAPYELHHTFGFCSRPRDPDVDAQGDPIEGKACVICFARDGNETHGWLCADPRFTAVVPQVKKGGSMRYCAPGSFQVFDGGDGTDTLYVPIQGASKAHVVTTGLDGNGLPYIGIQHADGLAITMLDGSVTIRNATGSAYVEVNGDGVSMNGNLRLNGGLAVGTGSTAAAKAVPLVTYLTALEAMLTTIAAAIDAKLTSTPGVTAGTVSAFVGAQAATKAAISALVTNVA